MRKLQNKRFQGRRTGAAMVEFAMIVVIFLTLLLGMIQFGVYLNATNAVVQITREGARFAATKGSCTQSDVQTYITGASVMPPQLRVSRMTTNPGSIAIQYYTPDGVATATRAVGGQVKITVTYDMRDKLFLGSGLLLNPLGSTYTSSSTFRVET